MQRNHILLSYIFINPHNFVNITNEKKKPERTPLFLQCIEVKHDGEKERKTHPRETETAGLKIAIYIITNNLTHVTLS